MAKDRTELEARAQELGLPWTQETGDADLEALISKAEEHGSLQAIEEEPACCGLHWDPIYEDSCKGCSHQDPCKVRFVRDRVPELLEECGGEHDVCADEASVSDSAWEICVLAHMALVGASEEAPEEKPEEASSAKKKKPPKRALPEKQLEMGAKPEEVGAPRPTPAGSAGTAAGPAKGRRKKPKKAKKRNGAPLAQEQAGELRHRTHARRHKQERERNPLIGQLVPGMVLKRKYKGKLWEMEILEEGYLLRDNNRIYPTLYMAVKAIVGTVKLKKQKRAHHKTRPTGTREVVPYSGPGFWNLRSQLRQLLLDAVSASMSPGEK